MVSSLIPFLSISNWVYLFYILLYIVGLFHVEIVFAQRKASQVTEVSQCKIWSKTREYFKWGRNNSSVFYVLLYIPWLPLQIRFGTNSWERNMLLRGCRLKLSPFFLHCSLSLPSLLWDLENLGYWELWIRCRLGTIPKQHLQEQQIRMSVFFKCVFVKPQALCYSSLASLILTICNLIPKLSSYQISYLTVKVVLLSTERYYLLCHCIFNLAGDSIFM